MTEPNIVYIVFTSLGYGEYIIKGIFYDRERAAGFVRWVWPSSLERSRANVCVAEVPPTEYDVALNPHDTDRAIDDLLVGFHVHRANTWLDAMENLQ